ncbi:MAG: TonB-dependent receptor plug domain-containing protein [Planctomycetes bacterium]|nr:TonB-dependent receptor plug domain-containing protein [Planctomycetota bacterium]MCB9885044.1 TonB-dependent receptor plug domain-containing protein [Planctomycetota bacterium]
MQLAAAISVATGVATAQGGDVFSLSLEDLAEVKVSVASVRDRPVREQPAVVTVITAEQIARMGAIDLLDILKTVPGFWVAADVVGGVLTPTFRGLAGGEGKILLIVDGVEQNDDLYGAPVIGQRYAAATIRRVEILRGPGSARYGGNAMLAVVKVFTKGAEVDGVEASLQSTSSARHQTNELWSFAGGAEIDDWTLSVSGHVDRGVKSTGAYTSPAGSTFALEDSSDLDSASLRLGAACRGFAARLQYDDIAWDDVLFAGGGDTQVNRREFEQFRGELSYELQVDEGWTITPRLTCSRGNPWGYTRLGETQQFLTARYQAQVESQLQTDGMGDLLVGVSFYRVQAELESGITSLGFDPATYYGDEQVHHNDVAVYTQYDFDTDWATFSVGARYEDHSTVGDKVVPRLAVTRTWDRWHGKLVYNRAFRVPQIETINTAERAGSSIRPETLDALEFELGYTGEGTTATGSVFWLENQDSIFFDTSLGTNGGNRNGGDIENWGGEFEVRHTRACWSAFGSYSFYQSRRNEVAPTVATGHGTANLGVPEHKGVLGLSWIPSDVTSVQATAIVLGRRWAYGYDGAGSSVQQVDPEVDLSLFLQHRIDRVTLGIGASNLLGTDIYYAQPYDGGLAPVPGQGRCLVLSMAARF